jgi:hypothetical protein
MPFLAREMDPKVVDYVELEDIGSRNVKLKI